TRNGDHPCERTQMRGIELAGIPPNFQIRVLHDLGGKIVPPYNPQDHAVKLGASSGVEPFECGCISLGDGRKEPCDLSWRLAQWPAPLLRSGSLRSGPACTSATGYASRQTTLARRTGNPRSTAFQAVIVAGDVPLVEAGRKAGETWDQSGEQKR